MTKVKMNLLKVIFRISFSKTTKIFGEVEVKQISGLKFDGPIWLGARAVFDIIDAKAALHSPGFVLRWHGEVPAFRLNL